MKSTILALAFLSVLALPWPTHGQPVDYSNCPACTPQAIQIVTEAITKYQGVKARNPKAPSTYGLVGTNKFNRTWGYGGVFDTFAGDNWLTIRRDKQNFCGTLDRFGIARYGDENDWNIHVVPAPGFEDFVSDAIVYKRSNWHGVSDDWNVSAGGRYTVEIEVTPDSSRYGNPWFPNHKPTPLLGKTVCAYGSFVREESHGNRPEIHPAELLWWKESEDKTVVLLVTDDSNRFNDNSRPSVPNGSNDDYDTRNVTDPNWVAWTLERDQEAEISIPFEINVDSEAVYLSIHALDALNVSRNATSSDVTPGPKHTITYRGASVLTVEETIQLAAATSVRFRDVCLDATRAVLQGFVVISTLIGNGDGEEGFVALQIDKRRLSASEQPAIVVGDLLGNWKTHERYNNQFAIHDVLSSDQFGKGIVDGMIDFNRNGRTDLFVRSPTTDWMVMYDGRGQWQTINNSGFPLPMLRFGDLNGDGRTDIIINNGDRLQVSYGGTGRWTQGRDIGRGNIQVADFNGDGRTDVVRMEIRTVPLGAGNVSFRGTLRVMWSGRGEWQTLQGGFVFTSADDYARNFRVGDFNGDGVADLFRYFDQRFMVYWNGTGDIKELQRPTFNVESVDNLMFVKGLSEPKKTDIVHVNPSTKQWIYNFGGLPGSIPMTVRHSDPLTVRFAELDGDPVAEPYTVDFVKTAQPSDVAVPPAVSAVAIDGVFEPEYRAGSVRRAPSGNEWVVDYVLKQFPGTSRLRNVTRVASVRDRRGSRGLSYRPLGEAVRNLGREPAIVGEIVGVPIGKADNEIIVTARLGAETRHHEVPTFTIAGMTATTGETIGERGGWDKWSRLITTSVPPQYHAVAGTAPPVVETVTAVKFELHPFYATVDEGKVGIAETSAFVKELNEVVQGDDLVKRRQLFNAESPFTITWKFELMDTTTGAQLQIDSASLKVTDGRFGNSQVAFAFPANTANLLQLRATVEVTDSLGNRFERSVPFEFWNQRVRFSDASQVNSWLQPVSPSDALKVRAAYFAEDGVLKPNELVEVFSK